MDFDRFSGIKENLIETGNGSYISLNDPGLCQKLLDNNFNSGPMLYNAGLTLKKQARRYLQEYKQTKSLYFLKLYDRKIKESMGLMKKSWDSGCSYAGKELLGLDSIRQSEKIKHCLQITRPLLAFLMAFFFLLGMTSTALYYFFSR